jgi:hypothetical protein
MVVFDRPCYRTAVVLFDERPSLRGIDVVRYFQSPEPVAGASCESYDTLLVDLSRSEDDLLAEMRKDTRYEIRRAADKDSVSHQMIDARDSIAVEQFATAYDQFARSKGLAPINRRVLAGYARGSALALSQVSRQDGETLVWHAYLLGQKRARLLHSASIFRDVDDKDMRALVGRANRLHHFRDMLHFKAIGLTEYDLGGWNKDTEDEEVQRVNRFKESFGGKHVCDYNGVLARSVKGRVALQLERAYVLASSAIRAAQRRYGASEER